jgi:hypothetical protein
VASKDLTALTGKVRAAAPEPTAVAVALLFVIQTVVKSISLGPEIDPNREDTEQAQSVTTSPQPAFCPCSGNRKVKGERINLSPLLISK